MDWLERLEIVVHSVVLELLEALGIPALQVLLDRTAHQDQPVLEEPLDLMVSSEPKVQQAHKEQLDFQEQQGILAHKEVLVRKVSLVQLGRLVLWETLVLKDNKVLQALMVMQEHLVTMAPRVNQGPWDRKVRREPQALMEPWERQVLLVQMVSQGMLDLPGRMANRVRRGQEVKMDSQDKSVMLVVMDNRVRRGIQVRRVIRDRRDRGEWTDNLALEAPQELLEHKVRRVIRAHQDRLETAVLLVPLVSLGQEEPLGLTPLLGHRVTPDLPDHSVSQDPKVQLDRPDRKGALVLLDRLVNLEPPETVDHLVPMDNKEVLDSLGALVQPVIEVVLGLRVSLETRE